jgi:septal ring factor EnvC (AmiA/AmiB activator)/ribosomal protein L40E
MFGEVAQPRSVERVCPICGAESSQQDRFCRRCGNAVPTIRAVSGYEPRRPGSFILAGAIGILALVAIGMGVLALVNYRRANTWQNRSHEWQSRAETSEQHAADVEHQLADTEGQLAVTKIALERSDGDRKTLQARVDQLAGEKASAEDQQRAAESERDSANYLLGLATRAATDARQCIADIERAVEAIANYRTTSMAYIDSLINQVGVSCGTSDNSYRRFAAAVG